MCRLLQFGQLLLRQLRLSVVGGRFVSRSALFLLHCRRPPPPPSFSLLGLGWCYATRLEYAALCVSCLSRSHPRPSSCRGDARGHADSTGGRSARRNAQCKWRLLVQGRRLTIYPYQTAAADPGTRGQGSVLPSCSRRPRRAREADVVSSGLGGGAATCVVGLVLFPGRSAF